MDPKSFTKEQVKHFSGPFNDTSLVDSPVSRMTMGLPFSDSSMSSQITTTPTTPTAT